MRKPNIFIASSGRIKKLAEGLKQELEGSQLFSRVLLWSDETKRNTGKTITEFLKESAKESDFVAVFLAKDDAISRNGVEFPAPRDNCVFEAGLFIGSLGLQFERCFLICDKSIAPFLLSDLKGIQHIPFTEPDLADTDACLGEMKRIVPHIRQQVEVLKRFKRPEVSLVTKDDLMDLERLVPNGNLSPGSVVVNATEPLERDYLFAERVMENMKANVEYLYFFHADAEGWGTNYIVEMIQILSLAGLIPGKIPESEPEWFSMRHQIMWEKPREVARNLELVRRHLSIHFLQEETPVEFCVHNAWSHQDAKCYLRYSKQKFIEWHHDAPNKARAIAKDLMNHRLADHPQVIFRSTRKFDLDADCNSGFKSSLCTQIKNYFVLEPEGRVEELCFAKRFSTTA